EARRRWCALQDLAKKVGNVSLTDWSGPTPIAVTFSASWECEFHYGPFSASSIRQTIRDAIVVPPNAGQLMTRVVGGVLGSIIGLGVTIPFSLCLGGPRLLETPGPPDLATCFLLLVLVLPGLVIGGWLGSRIKSLW